MRKFLLALYPPAWRERYGDELLAIVAHRSLRPWDVLDLVMGALDAWLSVDVRRAAGLSPVGPVEGGSMSIKALLTCDRNRSRVTPRDGLSGAGVMLAAALLLRTSSAAAVRDGWPAIGALLAGLVFPASFTVSMPFWLMKGQPWKAQTAIIGATLALLVLIS